MKKKIWETDREAYESREARIREIKQRGYVEHDIWHRIFGRKNKDELESQKHWAWQLVAMGIFVALVFISVGILVTMYVSAIHPETQLIHDALLNDQVTIDGDCWFHATNFTNLGSLNDEISCKWTHIQVGKK